MPAAVSAQNTGRGRKLPKNPLPAPRPQPTNAPPDTGVSVPMNTTTMVSGSSKPRATGPRPVGNATYGAFKKAANTKGMQAGERAVLQKVMDKRGVSLAEAKAIAKRRTSRGQNVGGVKNPGRPGIPSGRPSGPDRGLDANGVMIPPPGVKVPPKPSANRPKPPRARPYRPGPRPAPGPEQPTYRRAKAK